MTEFTPHDLPAGVRWSVRVIRPDTDEVLIDHQSDLVCATASIGKILLLLTVAERLTLGTLAADQPVVRPSRPVADSGLWQHLHTDHLSVADACLLVGAVSDNLATNALIELVGLSAVQQTADRLGLHSTSLHDVVRDVRTEDDPPALSTGTARELATVAARLYQGRALSTQASQQVVRWLRVDTDLSMVGSALGMDPLAHTGQDRGLRLWNKTGTNDGVRCDVGTVVGPEAAVTFAVLANWTADPSVDPTRDRVLDAMRQIGHLIREHVGGAL